MTRILLTALTILAVLPASASAHTLTKGQAARASIDVARDWRGVVDPWTAARYCTRIRAHRVVCALIDRYDGCVISTTVTLRARFIYVMPRGRWHSCD